MSIAALGTIAIGEYHEAVAVMMFYQVGEWFQGYAVDKSRASISELMDIRPETADVERDGGVVTVDPEEVEVGDFHSPQLFGGIGGASRHGVLIKGSNHMKCWPRRP